MIGMFPPPGSGPTIGDVIDAFGNFTFSNFIILILSLIFGWITAYFVLTYMSNSRFGIYTISFIIGNFIGILYFMVYSLLIRPLIEKHYGKNKKIDKRLIMI